MTIEESRNIRFTDKKYQEVFITSYKKDKNNLWFDVIMRTDNFFTFGCEGNDSLFNAAVRMLIRYPQSIYINVYKGRVLSSFDVDKISVLLGRPLSAEEKKEIEENHKALFDFNQNQIDKWREKWGIIKMNSMVLSTDCISTCHAHGPRMWLFPNGAINGKKMLGAESMDYIYQDLEKFNKEYPELDFDVSIFENENLVFSYHLGEDGITENKNTHSYEWHEKNFSKVNVMKFSKNRTPIQDFLWKTPLRHLPNFILDVIIPKRNDFFLGIHKHEQFFTLRELREYIDWWRYR